jgi:hypothetical protein
MISFVAFLNKMKATQKKTERLIRIEGAWMKKKQKPAINRVREFWTRNPVSKVKESGKKYNRKKKNKDE